VSKLKGYFHKFVWCVGYREIQNPARQYGILSEIRSDKHAAFKDKIQMTGSIKVPYAPMNLV